MPSFFPYALRPSTFRVPRWGAPASPCSCYRWRSATLWRSALFSHRSASRIFVVQPGCIPSPMVSLVGRSKPGCGHRPALSFKDLRHPGEVGKRAEPGFASRVGQRPASSSSIWGRRASSSPAEVMSSSHAREGEPLLPGQGAAVHPPPRQRSCCTPVAAVTALAERADFDNAGPVGRRRRCLQRVRLASSPGSDAASNAASRRSAHPRGLEWGSAGAGWTGRHSSLWRWRAGGRRHRC
jgi:hypothetical protein